MSSPPAVCSTAAICILQLHWPSAFYRHRNTNTDFHVGNWFHCWMLISRLDIVFHVRYWFPLWILLSILDTDFHVGYWFPCWILFHCGYCFPYLLISIGILISTLDIHQRCRFINFNVGYQFPRWVLFYVIINGLL